MFKNVQFGALKNPMVMVMVMVMHLYSAFSMWIYSNALYNTLWGTLPDCFMAQFTIFLM